MTLMTIYERNTLFAPVYILSSKFGSTISFSEVNPPHAPVTTTGAYESLAQPEQLSDTSPTLFPPVHTHYIANTLNVNKRILPLKEKQSTQCVWNFVINHAIVNMIQKGCNPIKNMPIFMNAWIPHFDVCVNIRFLYATHQLYLIHINPMFGMVIV